jgi:hypothetical protein
VRGALRQKSSAYPGYLQGRPVHERSVRRLCKRVKIAPGPPSARIGRTHSAQIFLKLAVLIRFIHALCVCVLFRVTFVIR